MEFRGQGLFVIGDPDQAIYGFRGTDPACFEYLKKYPSLKEITLNKTTVPYQQSLGAQAVISVNPGQRWKLEPVCTVGSPIRLVTAESVRAEAMLPQKKSTGSLAASICWMRRKNRLQGVYPVFRYCSALPYTPSGGILETCLRKEGIPYRVAGRDDFLADTAVRGSVSFSKPVKRGGALFGKALPAPSLERDGWSGREAAFERAAKRILH